MMRRLFIPITVVLTLACSANEQISVIPEIFYIGGDFSYVNEVEDCGAIYRKEGKQVDPFVLLSGSGANILRVRLWHSPEYWTAYSNFEDVKKTIKRAKESNMKVLLDFHYSDTWADPQHQIIPKAWKQIISTDVLADSVYQYTVTTLQKLNNASLLPEFVQVGNEINIELMQDSATMNVSTINWERNIKLINKGIQAVNDVAKSNETEIQVMLHIAQPENAFWWFTQANQNQLNPDFNWIGLSYYPKWSSYKKIDAVENAIDSIKKQLGKRVMVVETAYIYGTNDVDNAHNILGSDSLIDGYPATPQGQLDYLKDLCSAVKNGGGEGVIYWEPAWISSSCKTLWGQGSHWDNATFFNAQNNNEALPASDIYKWLSE